MSSAAPSGSGVPVLAAAAASPAAAYAPGGWAPELEHAAVGAGVAVPAASAGATGPSNDAIAVDALSAPAGDEVDAIRAPKLSPWQIFKLFFFHFGLRAWGGPVAQMAMLKQQLVVEQRWISVQRFNRVVAVYQVLPGPEATELCCYFGLLAGGRLGAFLAGLAFLLPGFVLMLLAAWAYTQFGEGSSSFISLALSALSPVVTAMVFRAVHKIGQHAVEDPDTHQFDWRLAACAANAAVQSVMQVNFFITLLHSAVLYGVCLKPGRHWLLSSSVALLPYMVFIPILARYGSIANVIPMGVGAGALGRAPGPIFLVGLLGGLLTFGGAYTAIPFMQYEAVVMGKWLSNAQFLDSIAIGQVLPSPLVIFSTFVGFLSGGVLGAVLMTIGMFLPAFSFTLIGHDVFERIVSTKGTVTHMLDGVSAAVVGLIAVTAVQLLKACILRPIDAIVFGAAMTILYKSTHKLTPIALVLAAALAGVVLYGGDAPDARAA
ncbi:chromate efflux transporter [archaeon]|nr:MAG: chromate efflux transporter [archaeon]